MTKHTILFLAANPLGTDRLALDQEARAIQIELERSGHRDQFELVTRWAAEPLDLLRELRRLKPMVVHFSGHGKRARMPPQSGPHRDVVNNIGAAKSNDGEHQHGLYFQSPDGGPQLVSTAALEQTFGAAGSSVKLVILSACYSESQADALLVHVDCVVGMIGAIRDEAARSFAVGFYGGLAERESIEAAYKQGRAAMSLEGLDDAARPQLKVRGHIRADRLVLAKSLDSRPPPLPRYADAATEKLCQQLAEARERKQRLKTEGQPTGDVDREIIRLRRELHEGGRLRAGDALDEGRFLLVEEIGHRGFAFVWRAFDTARSCDVAIKVLHANLAGDSLRVERFFRGARIMAELDHKSVVRVLVREGHELGFHFFVMEYLAGGNLHDAVVGKRIALAGILAAIFAVGDVLALAHARGYVHRDIKPENILLAPDGTARLADFDLVGALDTTAGTRTGMLGTYIYAAPEQLERPQDADARADVHGLGMTLVFALHGRRLPHRAALHRDDFIETLDCSTDMKAILKQAIAIEPADRIPSVASFCLALSALPVVRAFIRSRNPPRASRWWGSGGGRTGTERAARGSMESAEPNPELPETVVTAPPHAPLAVIPSPTVGDECMQPQAQELINAAEAVAPADVAQVTTFDARLSTMLGPVHKRFHSAVAGMLRFIGVVVGLCLLAVGVLFIAFSSHESTDDDAVASSPRGSSTAVLITLAAQPTVDAAAPPASPGANGSAATTPSTALAPTAAGSGGFATHGAAVAPQPASDCLADVRSQPAGADIVISQTNVIGTTPQRVSLPCGREVELVIRKPRFVQATRTVTPTPEGAIVQVALARQKFQVEVSSTPFGATITVDGKSLGVTPTMVNLPAFETSTLVFFKDGYEAKPEKVIPRTNGAAVHSVLKELERKPATAPSSGNTQPVASSAPPPPAPPRELRARIDDVEVSGSLPRGEVRRAVERRRSAIADCTAASPETVIAHFTIGEARRAQGVIATGSTAETNACIISAFSDVWTEAAPDVGVVQVTVRIAFVVKT